VIKSSQSGTVKSIGAMMSNDLDDGNDDYMLDEEADMNNLNSSLNPFQRNKSSKTKKTSQGLYGNVPNGNEEDDYENCSRSQNVSAIENDDDRIILLINQKQCRFFVVLTFTLALLATLFVGFDREKTLLPLDQNGGNASTHNSENESEYFESIIDDSNQAEINTEIKQSKMEMVTSPTPFKMPFQYSHLVDPFQLSSSSSSSSASFEYASLFSPPSDFANDQNHADDSH